MNFIRVKKIIYPVQNGQSWFDTSYNANIYRGCNQNCIYCDSRSNCYQIPNFDEVKAKEDAHILVDHELSKKRKRGVLSLGGMSDPYNYLEKKLKYTRSTLTSLDKYGFGVSIITKSTLVERDIDILKRITSHSPVAVSITITTADDRLQSRIERNVSSTSDRFRALKSLCDNGIYAGITLMPLLPFINDTAENVDSIVKKAHEAGAKYIYASFGVTLRENQRQHFFKHIGPELTNKYIQTFGDSYMCSSPNHKSLRNKFETLCQKYGIVYKMKDIIKGMSDNIKNEQLSLF